MNDLFFLVLTLALFGVCAVLVRARPNGPEERERRG
jgi:hypothetical protein